jgi:hypothetical protein
MTAAPTAVLRAVTRLAILLVALVFIAGFAFLTASTIVEQGGVSLGTAVSVFVIVLMGVGIVGALRNPPR